jgi:single-strand DNA-binding protein
MASVNKVLLIGNLGADPETRYLPGGDAVCTLRLATTDKWKDKTSGDMRETTEWHRVVLFRRLADVANEYLKKGAAVYVEGRLRTRKWQDKDGKERYTTEIEASEMKMLGSTRGETQPSTPMPGKKTGAETEPEPWKTAHSTPMDWDGDVPF